MKRQSLRLVGLGIIAGAFCFPARAVVDPYRGAIALMDRFPSSSSSRTTPPREATDGEYIRLKAAAEDFAQKADSLPPDEAARQWLALFDRFVALPEGSRGRVWGPNSSAGILNYLPGPATWPILQKLVEARAPLARANAKSEATLLFILHTLNNDETKQWADLAALSAPKSAYEAMPSAVWQLGSALSLVTGKPAEAEAYWNRLFESLAQQTASSDDDDLSISLPDFVTLFGPAKAEALLLQALTQPKVKIYEVFGEATQKLARKIALGHVAEIKQAPWVLTHSLNGNDLYEALTARFKSEERDDYEADLYHALALAVRGKVGEATAALAKIDRANSIENAINQTAGAGYGPEVYAFLKTFLAEHPEYPLWSSFITIAARTGHGDEALKFVQQTLARKDLTAEARGAVQPILYRALLAVDQTEAGVDELRVLIKASQARIETLTSSPPAHDSGGAQKQDLINKLMGWDIDLAKLGILLKREELVTEGVADARSRTPKDKLVVFLINAGRTGEAKTLLLASLDSEAEKTARMKQGNPRVYHSNLINTGFRRDLVFLTAAYYNAGQWENILSLLEKSPSWAASDLVAIAREQVYLGTYPTHNLSFMAARALAETGKANLARPILDYSLRLKPSDDDAYALLLKIGEGDLVAKLDALYRLDQFENRPLIWKATVLLQQGKIAEAEAACKAAIAVDPSDGQTGKGNRMRVYSVMADICDAKKDAQQAAFFRNVVKAIRLSEDADDYYAVGMITRAVKMYGQALDLFSDAYCIQSRLARQLAQLGRMEEAAVHYRKAFELMPVSFGRMESHCFGCERAFEGKTASGIARQVFTEMLAKTPDKPQLYYLRGYLETEDDEFPEALADYAQAVKLDPDYINAWKKIIGIGQDYQLDPALGDEAIFNVLRLDPARRHSLPSTRKVKQLARLWTAIETANQAIPPRPKSLYPLTASAAKIAEAEALVQVELTKTGTPEAQKRALREWKEQMASRNFSHDTPRELVLRTVVIVAALNFLR